MRTPVWPTWPKFDGGGIWDFFLWLVQLFSCLIEFLLAIPYFVFWSVLKTFAYALDNVVALVPDPPGWVADAIGGIAWAVDGMLGLCSWINAPILAVSVGIVMTMWAAGLVLRIARIVASFATLGGGGA